MASKVVRAVAKERAMPLGARASTEAKFDWVRRHAATANRTLALFRTATMVFRVARALGVFKLIAPRRRTENSFLGRVARQPSKRGAGPGLLTIGSMLMAGSVFRLMASPARVASIALPTRQSEPARPRLAPLAPMSQPPTNEVQHERARQPATQVTLKGVGLVAWNAAKAWSDRRASSKGAALALYTLLSLAPILILVLAAAGLFIDPATVQQALLVQMNGLMGPAGADAVKTILVSARHADTGIVASVVSVLVLLVSATTAFAELKDSLDELWETNKPTSSGIWLLLKERFLSVGVLLVLALMLLSSLALSAGLDAAAGLMGDSAATVIGRTGAVAITYLAVTVLFAVIFRFLPAASLSWRDVTIGAALTGALFLVGKTAIGLYLAHGGVSSAYGAAGSVVALVVWIYYSAQIFFYGSLFTRGFAVKYGSHQQKTPLEQ